jgi:hypothetical protein
MSTTSSIHAWGRVSESQHFCELKLSNKHIGRWGMLHGQQCGVGTTTCDLGWDVTGGRGRLGGSGIGLSSTGSKV